MINVPVGKPSKKVEKNQITGNSFMKTALAVIILVTCFPYSEKGDGDWRFDKLHYKVILKFFIVWSTL